MKITKTWAEKNLKAVNTTIKRYKNGTQSSLNCAFCRLALYKGCRTCPWVIFKGYQCFSWTKTGKSYIDCPIPLRLRRLYGWRKRLENIIKKFKEAR